MPAMERDTRFRKQEACLWEYSDSGDDGFEVSAVTQIYVRWIYGKQVETSPTGEVISTDVTVVADQYITPESIMWLGKKSALPSPVAGIDLYQIKTSKITPDIKGRSTRRTYGLIRYHRSLPTVAS